MSDEAPAPPPLDAPKFDAGRLIADLRKDDETAIQQGYRMVFGGRLGRLVLAHILRECGVGQPFGAGMGADDIHYRAGAHDAALNISSRAGFDQASIVALQFSEDLEGNNEDDRQFNYAADGGEFLGEF